MLMFSSIYKIIMSHDAIEAFQYSETATEQAWLITKTSQQKGKKYCYFLNVIYIWKNLI
jgi:hypothetical protein